MTNNRSLDKSTVDADFILRQIAKKSVKHNISFLVFVDLAQAFLSFRLSDVLTILKQTEIDPRMILIVKATNIYNTTGIRIENNYRNFYFYQQESGKEP